MKRRWTVVFALWLAQVLAGSYGLTFNVWWDNVHETITKTALLEAAEMLSEEVDKKFAKALKGDRGVRYPDMPEGLIKLAINIHKKGTLSYESHYGAYQYWHSMAFPAAKTAEQVRERILKQAGEWYDAAYDARKKGDNKTAGEYMGRLLHMVQDSYSGSHVKRDEHGRIAGFQDYDAQDAGEHAAADSPSRGNPHRYEDLEKYLPGAVQAMEASRDLLVFYLRGDKSSFMARTEAVYDVAPGAYPRKDGPRTEEEFKKKGDDSP